MIVWIASIPAAFIIGSIPFGFLIARRRGVDIRQVGSGNVGATNVGRALGRRFGIGCFLLDAAKGAVPVVAAGLLGGTWGRPLIGTPAAAPPAPEEIWAWLAVAAAALLGHMFPPWLGFRGGKGVATGFGAMLAMWPVLTLPAAIALVVWAATVGLFRIVSLASVAAALSLPVSCVLLGGLLRGAEDAGGPVATRLAPVIATVGLAALVVFRHRGNLARLRKGTEPRLGR
ncbi:MAG: glycerol-3-phosphate acyltransferase [Planctomycetota bacterium]|jgi:glycerol-3-phosphate acyltransferase PlsY